MAEKATTTSTTSNILRISEVCKIVGLSSSQVYGMAAQGDFPRQIRLSKRASGWLESEVRQWVDERIALSRPNSPDAA